MGYLTTEQTLPLLLKITKEFENAARLKPLTPEQAAEQWDTLFTTHLSPLNIKYNITDTPRGLSILGTYLTTQDTTLFRATRAANLAAAPALYAEAKTQNEEREASAVRAAAAAQEAAAQAATEQAAAEQAAAEQAPVEKKQQAFYHVPHQEESNSVTEEEEPENFTVHIHMPPPVIPAVVGAESSSSSSSSASSSSSSGSQGENKVAMEEEDPKKPTAHIDMPAPVSPPQGAPRMMPPKNPAELPKAADAQAALTPQEKPDQKSQLQKVQSAPYYDDITTKLTKYIENLEKDLKRNPQKEVEDFSRKSNRKEKLKIAQEVKNRLLTLVEPVNKDGKQYYRTVEDKSIIDFMNTARANNMEHTKTFIGKGKLDGIIGDILNKLNPDSKRKLKP